MPSTGGNDEQLHQQIFNCVLCHPDGLPRRCDVDSRGHGGASRCYGDYEVMPRQGGPHHRVYDVELKSRTRYRVRVVAATAAEACRKASEHFTTARTVKAPWSADELERRIEATIPEGKVERGDAI
jgi:hypothetical protein